MSVILTDKIQPRTTGIALTVVGDTNVSGALTCTNFTASGNVTIGGTLTYEDVTNIDVVGVSTFAGRMNVNSSALFNEGLNVTAGVTTIAGTTTFGADITIPDKIIHSGDTNTNIRFPAADTVSVETGGSERVRVDSNGKILQGSSTSRNTGLMAASPTFQLEGVGSNASNIGIFCNSNGTAAGGIEFGKTRGTSNGGTTVVQSGDDLGHISFEGSDGSAQRVAARINVQVDGTPGSSDMPGRIRFLTTPDGSASEAERMRLDSSGDLILGTTTSAGRLTVDSGTSNTCATFQSSDSGAGIHVKDDSARSSIEQNGTTLKISADTGAEHANSDIRLQVDGSTKMLIDHNGNIKMGTTGSYKAGERILIQKSAGYNDGVVAITQDDSTVTERRFLYFFNDQGGVAGSVRHTGATACQYHTSSDYRLKENVVDITDGISRIKQLKPKRFNFKTEPGETVDGFLAHEVSPVIPDAVSGDKDGEVMQSLGYERLTPLLTAALKEAIAKIETLEAKVAALESS